MKAATGSNHDRNPRIEAAFREFREMLERLAYTITRNHADAEDVVQDVFLDLIAVESFPPDFDTNPGAYLQQAAFNRAVHVRFWR
jgi:DNA-directed RNA polymerase specialized sigma24 family protein